MSAKDEPAFPQMANSAGYYAIQPSGGLTKRELAAFMAMQGMLAHVAPTERHPANYGRPMAYTQVLACDAVAYADALLADLAKEKS